MKPGARLKAAVDVLTEITKRHRPAALALADWGKASRYAGSGDRAAVGNLVYDALRRRSSIAARMGSGAPRALVLGAAERALGLAPDAVETAADGSRHALSPLTAEERAGLIAEVPADASLAARADLPEWIVPSLTRVFGERLVEEGMALAERAPVDVRVNTLKASRDQVMKALTALHPEPVPFSPVGLRFSAPVGPARQPHVEAEPAHGKGWYEVQDAGSQVAALMTGVQPGDQVLDLCAGAGGKTLAMAAAMKGEGRILAYDADKHRLRPIFERLTRSGASNVEVLRPGDTDALDGLAGKLDVVLVDAPCTGTGTWRRRPDSKWRLRADSIAQRQTEQRAVLARAAALVRPGGRVVYVTCSLLPEENADQVEAFLAGEPDFQLVPSADAWRAHLPGTPPRSADGRSDMLTLTPASHGTDGFYIAVIRRSR